MHSLIKEQVNRQLFTSFFIAILCLSQIPASYASPTYKFDDTKWISIGAGIRSSFETSEGDGNGGNQIDGGSGDQWSQKVYLDNARIYVNGQVHKYLKFEVNTDCVRCGSGGQLQLLDAIGKVEYNSMFNLWLGRMLVPGERRELNGPFYNSIYQAFRAGSPFEPSDNSNKIQSNGTSAGVWGRDDGATVWGAAFDERLQYSFGFFRGLRNGPNNGPASNPGANVNNSAMYAQRISYNFWQVEKNPGYYTSGTYYGKGGDILTAGVYNQYQYNGVGTYESPSNFRGSGFDVLMEKILPNKAVLTLEGDYKNYGISGAYNKAARNAPCKGTACGFSVFEGQSYDLSGMYLFPQKVVFGHIQPYVRYVNINPNGSTNRNSYQTGINYVVDGHNSIFSLNYLYGDMSTKGVTNYNSNVTGNNASTIILGAQWQI